MSPAANGDDLDGLWLGGEFVAGPAGDSSGVRDKRHEMIISMADVIFFDLDGTLVDHRSAVLEAIGQIVQAAPNAAAPPEELVMLWWTLGGAPHAGIPGRSVLLR
ncbi:HAD family hydrolase [Parafrankia sp. BMG5.11]|uniref:HAD family hydrolase n=1 Tax=Parafrankia sp. Ea1.12 TaxID=573499 RepID=UPI000DA509D7|nr:HAD family hydrolase [Parafrankia sp. Ea1.12]TCJ35026.1 HAD family hydrolase [Parafrankia sp. BMG5.11]SQD97328.1 hypothetical protein FMEAI12_4020057 [Parafrankia sp. Ea1.12]